jgi:hypothetical protein
MAATETSYRVCSLPQELQQPGEDKAFAALGRTLDVGAFGVGAAYQRRTGEAVIRDHHEAGPGGDRHEELYVVVQGGARFTVDGEDVDAPHGTAIFLRDPAAMRSAVATADDTIVLAVGGPRDTAYRLTPAQSQEGFWDAYGEEDWASALVSTRRALEIYPGNAHLLYNVACMQARLGDDDASLTALAESVARWEPYKEMARKDDDFESLREDPRFLELVT